MQPMPANLNSPKRGMSTGMKIGLGVGALVIAVGALGAIGGNDKSKTSSTPSRSSGSGVVADTPTTTKSNLTRAQENAVKSATSYIDYSSFSKEGLIRQLQVEKFSVDDATFAVEYLERTGGVDWNDQAVKSAKSYLSYSSFSLEGLIRQLEVERFTPAQAEYGAKTAYGS